jgi:type II secretory pathway pseudopilin PulG
MQSNRGFTIIESLVAITILMMVIIGVSSAVQTALSSNILSKEQVIAFYLAQEGAEQIRNMRDNNGIVGINDWLTGIASVSSDPCYFGKACMIDVTTNTINECPGPSSCPVLRQDLVRGYYGYDPTWTPTIYERVITLSQVPGSSKEIIIFVTVKWSKGLIDRQFSIRSNIINWQNE